MFSKGAGHDVVVHSFPFKLEAKKLEEVKKQYSKSLTDFWSNLAIGYNYFEEKKQLPQITVEVNGSYKIILLFFPLISDEVSVTLPYVPQRLFRTRV